MLIEITEQDIKEGRPGSPSYCPIARALRRSGFIGSMVWGSRIEYKGNDYPLNEGIQEWTQNFDIEGPESVKPFVLEFSPDATSN